MSRDRVNEFRKHQATDNSIWLSLFGNPAGSKYGLGYQLFNFMESGGNRRVGAFGHRGTGGSLVLCDPATEFVYCFLVNKIVPGNDATLKLLDLVCTELSIGKPVDFELDLPMI